MATETAEQTAAELGEPYTAIALRLRTAVELAAQADGWARAGMIGRSRLRAARAASALRGAASAMIDSFHYVIGGRA